jgi:hypothetical protein
MSWLLGCLATVMALYLVWAYHRDRERLRHRRRIWFDAVRPLFAGGSITQQGADYPVLRGRYQGYDIELLPMVEGLAMRKLPSLWLQVTVYAAIPFGGGLDYLARPLGVEFYSPTDCFTVRLPVPEAWPAHAVLQTDNPADMPPLDVIEPHMALFQDQRAKELLVTPKGVRLVYQAAQAEQGPYQTLRLVRFPLEPLDPDLARALMDAAVGLVHDLRDAGAASRRQQPFQPIGQQLERVAAS